MGIAPKNARDNRSPWFEWSRLLGYDIFISYRRTPTSVPFARNLRNALVNEGYCCFLDQEDSEGGVHLTPALKRALKRSSLLAVIAEPAVVESEWVRDEIDFFWQDSAKTILPINIGGFLKSDAALAGPFACLRKVTWVDEDKENYDSGAPSQSLVETVNKAFGRRAVRARSRAVVAGTLTVVSSAAVVALWQWAEAARQRRDAQSRELAAISQQHVDREPAVALDYAIRASDIRQTVEAERALSTALALQKTQVILRQGTPVWRAAFSPDGTLVVAVPLEGVPGVWHAASGRQLHQLTGHAASVTHAAFSPDGSRIVTVSADRKARVWDAATGQQIQQLTGHDDAVNFAAYSPDGSRLVTVSDDGTARVWDAATGHQLHQLAGHKDRVVYAAFAPDGRRVVTASVDRTARVWDATEGEHLYELVGHTGTVWCAAFSPDGQRVLTAGDDRIAQVWDAASGRRVHALEGHGSLIRHAEFSPDGRRIVTAAADWRARVWDASTGKQLHELAGHTDVIEYAAFSPDSLQIVTASSDRTARVLGRE